MKSIRNKTFMLIFLLMGIFFIGIDKVEAGNLNYLGVKVECIYSDGGAYTVSNIVQKKVDSTIYYTSNINRITYNLVGVDNTKSATTSSNIYINYPAYDDFDLEDHKCSQWLRSGTVTEEDDDGNDKSTSYHKFGDGSEAPAFEEGDFTGASWWNWFWTGNKTAADKRNEATNNGGTYRLVSERYIVTEDAGTPDYTLTYKDASDQAAGSDAYVYIMVYGDTYLLKTKDKTTLLEEGVDHFSGIYVNDQNEVVGIDNNDTIYINSPEASSSIDSSNVPAYSYKYGQIRYKISTSKGGDYTRKLILFNTGIGKGDAPDTELCDSIMPETSKILKRIIGIAQIMVPVLMIILCAIDIGRIVLSGNIEEDLPKQKKKIITRIVIGVLFFFTPLIVMLTLDLMKDSGAVNAEDIKDISCLFE